MEISAKINYIFDDEKLRKIEEGRCSSDVQSVETASNPSCCSTTTLIILQKLLAELIGTYFIVFTGCGAIMIEKINGEVTYPGICLTWGLIIMIVVYTFEHISCHFNPAVTITYALLRGFPFKQVPLYIAAQVTGSILASGTLDLLFEVTPQAYFGTTPSGSNAQALVMEIIISFILMFVIFGTAFDDRAHNEFAGVAIGMTVLINALIGGTISGASMNPARSLGPAIVKHVYEGLWIYMVGPTLGCIGGGVTYNLVRYLDKLPSEVTRFRSFLKISEPKVSTMH